MGRIKRTVGTEDEENPMHNPDKASHALGFEDRLAMSAHRTNPTKDASAQLVGRS
jgi:hypothetical protein